MSKSLEKSVLDKIKVIKESSYNSFNFLDVPEIYQVEVTSACNFECSFCPRTNKKVVNVNIDLVKQMVNEGMFKNSFFVELQFEGEPLLYPQLKEVAKIIKDAGVKVGLSTNGFLIDKKLDVFEYIDSVTISVDSFIDYEKYRIKGNKDVLIKNILLLEREYENKLDIDYQVIDLLDGNIRRNKQSVEDFVKGFNLRGKVRVVPDCSIAIREKKKLSNSFTCSEEFCLNPFMSVSIKADGRVVSCCFVFGDWKENTYGRLTEKSTFKDFESIWQGKIVNKLRKAHLSKKGYPQLCRLCYMRSPVLLHVRMLRDYIRRNV